MDLYLVETDELLEELFSRVDMGGIVLKQVLDDSRETVTRRWKGNCHEIIGACHDLSAIVLSDYRAQANRRVSDDTCTDEEPA